MNVQELLGENKEDGQLYRVSPDPYGWSRMMINILCMRHQVTCCASLAAVDSTALGTSLSAVLFSPLSIPISRLPRFAAVSYYRQ
jgi:hypothetical protein